MLFCYTYNHADGKLPSGRQAPAIAHPGARTAGAALNRISRGIQGGETPLQFSDAINIAQQQCGNRATLQFVARQMRLHDGGSAVVHALAKTGFQGPAQDYPYRDQIQQAFGHHDISSLRAHTGAAARNANSCFGSSAYHKGGEVAFAATPTLADAAHEAAHYVQNAGAGQLGGDVGEAGDAYERHADLVAENVVAGETVADLLDRGPGAPTHGARTRNNAPVQMTGGGVPPLAALCLESALQNRAPRTDVVKLLMSIRTGLYLDSAQKETNPYSQALADKWVETTRDKEAAGIRNEIGRFELAVRDEPISPWTLVRECIPRGGPGNNCGDPDSAGTHSQENIIQHEVVNYIANKTGFTTKPSLVRLNPADKARMNAEGENIFHNEQEPLAELNLLKREITTNSATPVSVRSPDQAAELQRLRARKTGMLDYWGQVSGRPGAAKQVARDQADLAGVPLIVLDDKKYWIEPGKPDNAAISAEIRHLENETGAGFYLHLQGAPGTYPDQLCPVHPRVDTFAQDFTGITSIPGEVAVIRGEPGTIEKTQAEGPSYVGSADTTKEGSMDVAHSKELYALSYIGHEGLFEAINDLPLTEPEREETSLLTAAVEELSAGYPVPGDRRLLADIITQVIRALVLATLPGPLRKKLDDWLKFIDLQNQYMRGKFTRLMGFPYGGAAHIEDNLVAALKLLMARQRPLAVGKKDTFEAETGAIRRIGGKFTTATPPGLLGGYISSGGTAGNDLGIGRGRRLGRARGKFPVVFGSEGAHYSYKKINMQNRIADSRTDSQGFAPGYEESGNSADTGMDSQGRIQVDALVDKVCGALQGKDIYPVLMLTFGTTNAGAMDPVKQVIVELGKRGIDRDRYYIHLDGAYSLGYIFGSSAVDFSTAGWEFGFDSEAESEGPAPRFEWNTILDVVDSISISGHKAFNAVTPSNKISSYFIYRKVTGDESVAPLEDVRDARVAEAFHRGLATGGAQRAQVDLGHTMRMSGYVLEKLKGLTGPGGPLEGMYWYYNNNTFVLPRVKNAGFTYKWSIPHDSAETHIIIQAHISEQKIDEFFADAVEQDVFERPGQKPQAAEFRFPRR